MPVLTGIGHETDQAVADLVAHTSHKTPTACAGAVVELALVAASRVELAWRDLAVLARRAVDAEAGRLDDHARHAARVETVSYTHLTLPTNSRV